MDQRYIKIKYHVEKRTTPTLRIKISHKISKKIEPWLGSQRLLRVEIELYNHFWRCSNKQLIKQENSIFKDIDKKTSNYNIEKHIFLHWRNSDSLTDKRYLRWIQLHNNKNNRELSINTWYESSHLHVKFEGYIKW